MAGHLHKPAGQAGVTLIELLIVIVIIAIVAGFALLRKGSANEQFKRQNVAQQLKVALERARFDSVKRRGDAAAVQAKIVVTTNSYTLTTDRNHDGTITSADDLSTDLNGQNIVIGGQGGTVLPKTIYFNQRGETVDSSGNSISASFYVCNVSCSAPANGTANIVMVTSTGTVNLLPGSGTPPTFAAPNVSSVPPGTDIRPLATFPSP